MWWADRRNMEEPRQVWPNNTCRYPSTWDRSIQTTSYRLVEVPKYQHQDEYEKIQKVFSKTLPEGNITKLERVQNYNCWATYARQKEVMVNKNCFHELRLFHGTKEESVEDICRENFDFRLSGTRVGAIYGQGAYFARKAKYSNDYAKADAHNIKKMFVARVLVGKYTCGTEDMRRPPYKDPSDRTKGMYDSCVDNASDPNIFVIFDNHQVYPEYLITYSTSANQISLIRSFIRNFRSVNQIFHRPSSGNHQSSNQQSLRSVVGANQTAYSSSNQHSSNPYYSAQSPHSSANQQSPNTWPFIQSMRSALNNVNNRNDTFTQLVLFSLFLLFIISISVLLSYTPSSIFVTYLLFCLLTSAVIYINGMNVWSVCRIVIIVILSFLLLSSLVLQLFTHGLQILLSFCYNNLTIYTLFSIFISAMIYANEMKIDVKPVCKWVLLSELFIVLLLPVIQLFLYLFIILTSFCYNNFGILYLMISMLIFAIVYTNKNMVVEYKYKCGLISELFMLLMLPVLPLFLYILQILFLCCYNKFVIYIGLLFFIVISAMIYEDKMNIKNRHVCKWVLISELIILLLLPVLQLFLYLLQILVYFLVVIFVLVSILIPTMILNLVCM